MSAVIVVLDTPWFAVSNSQGSFRIADAPPGEYAVKVFYERASPDALDKLSAMSPSGRTISPCPNAHRRHGVRGASA